MRGWQISRIVRIAGLGAVALGACHGEEPPRRFTLECTIASVPRPILFEIDTALRTVVRRDGDAAGKGVALFAERRIGLRFADGAIVLNRVDGSAWRDGKRIGQCATRSVGNRF